MVACTRRQPKADALQTALAMGAPTSASISAVPDLQQEIAVGGPPLERLARRAKLLLIRLLRIPYHLMLLPFSQLRGEIASLRAAAVESLAYVGVELRRIGDLVESGAPNSALTPEETTLARHDVHGALLSRDGALVMGAPGGGNGSGNGFDEGALAELGGWAVAERIVVARRTGS